MCILAPSKIYKNAFCLKSYAYQKSDSDEEISIIWNVV